MDLTRRSFLLLLAIPTLPPIRVGVVLAREHASLWRGIRFGAEEARHTAGLLGRAFELVDGPSAVTIRGPVVTIAAGGRTFRISPDAPGRVAWHPSLKRFGAGELNERFLKKTSHAMDEAAWLGWIAVKIAAEAGLRNRGIGAARIDGHKGVSLRFAPDGKLIQPLYVVRNGVASDA
jgi:hypothetical protein